MTQHANASFMPRILNHKNPLSFIFIFTIIEYKSLYNLKASGHKNLQAQIQLGIRVSGVYTG